MALETVNYVGDLVVTNPPGTDPKSQGDDQIRNLKIGLVQSFAGFTGAICVTGTDGGAANAYTLTPTTALTAYGTKMIAIFAPTANNTGAATLNISGLGAKSIKSVSGAALVSGDLVSGSVYAAVYNGTEFRLLSPTKNYIDQLAFGSSLPAQIADYFVTSNGTAASFSNLLKAGVIRFADSTDTTKLLAFDASGITTGTTRTVTIPNKSGTLAMTSDLTVNFQSADQTITSAGSLTIAHGMGTTPKLFQPFLKAVNSVLGYTAGDITPALMTPSSNQGAVITADATNIYIRFGSAVNTFVLLNKTTGALAAITDTDWSFFVRAWA